MDIRLQVRHYIEENHLICPGDHVIAALSGGADSVCLLAVLDSLRESLRFTLAAVHVNHGIRGQEADRDEQYCRDLCDRLKIALSVCETDVPGEAARRRITSLEEAGRDVRYECLEERAEAWSLMHPGCTVSVALAHHMDDQAETVLMNLCRGADMQGAAGMPPRRGIFIRPLLGCRHRDIEEWLRLKGISWCEDSSNRSLVYARNRVRRELIPWLENNLNPRAVDHLCAFADRAREQRALIVREADSWIAGLPDDRTAPAAALRRMPQVIRREVLCRLIVEHGGIGTQRVSSRQIALTEHLLDCPEGSEVTLSGGLTVCRTVDALIFLERGEAEEWKREQVSVRPSDEKDKVLSFRPVYSVIPRREDQKIPDEPYTKWFDYDKITDDIVFRTREPGDEIVLAGVGTKNVRRYMIDEKIPASERDRIPVLAMGKRVLWIVGYRMSAEFQITEKTKTILQVTVYPAEDPRKGEHHE